MMEETGRAATRRPLVCSRCFHAPEDCACAEGPVIEVDEEAWNALKAILDDDGA